MGSRTTRDLSNRRVLDTAVDQFPVELNCRLSESADDQPGVLYRGGHRECVLENRQQPYRRLSPKQKWPIGPDPLRAPFIAQKKYLRIVGELMDAAAAPTAKALEEAAQQQGSANREKS